MLLAIEKADPTIMKNRNKYRLGEIKWNQKSLVDALRVHGRGLGGACGLEISQLTVLIIEERKIIVQCHGGIKMPSPSSLASAVPAVIPASFFGGSPSLLIERLLLPLILLVASLWS
jgi:hypothetical protein